MATRICTDRRRVVSESARYQAAQCEQRTVRVHMEVFSDESRRSALSVRHAGSVGCWVIPVCRGNQSVFLFGILKGKL